MASGHPVYKGDVRAEMFFPSDTSDSTRKCALPGRGGVVKEGSMMQGSLPCLILFILLVVGLIMLMVKRSGQARAIPADRITPPMRDPIKNPQPIVLTLGSGVNLRESADHDFNVYRKIFPNVKALSIASIYHLRSALYDKPYHMIHIINNFDSDGRVIWEDGVSGEILDIFEACADSDSFFVFLASGFEIRERQGEFIMEIVNAHSLLEEPSFSLAVIFERGSKFDSFLKRFLKKMQRGEPPLAAWFDIRPQDAGAPPPAVDPGPEGFILGVGVLPEDGSSTTEDCS
jgi:hypothetical protein